jgi:hypothetical protein
MFSLVADLPAILSLVLLAFLLLLSSLPTVDGVLVVAGGLAIASIPADPGSLFKLTFLHTVLYNVHCTMELIRGTGHGSSPPFLYV